MQSFTKKYHPNDIQVRVELRKMLGNEVKLDVAMEDLKKEEGEKEGDK